MSGIKSTYIDSSARVKVKGDESEQFRIDRMRQGYIMAPWQFNVYMDGVMKEVRMMGKRGVRFLEDGRELILPGLLYGDDLVLCGESQEDLRVDGGMVYLRCVEKED